VPRKHEVEVGGARGGDSRDSLKWVGYR
jgi:hypothetical protein